MVYAKDISRNLVLEGFSDNLFEMSHYSIFANSEFTLSFREFFMLKLDNISAVSSAKCLVINLDAFGRSLIQRGNNDGPDIDPWGTPPLQFVYQNTIIHSVERF